MKKDNELVIIKQTAAFVQKDFEVEYIPDDVTEEELLKFLAQIVHGWIDNNMERLFYALYRLDINERKVHLALSPNAVALPHEAIAKLILDREKQKAITRIEYDQTNQDVGDGWNS